MCEYKKPSHRHGEHRLGDDQQFWPSTEIFRYIQRRQNGHHVGYYPRRLMSQFVARQLPGLLSEKEYALGDINKIFASHWASDRQVAFGTKCNKLIVMDLVSKQMVQIPSLQNSGQSSPADCPCGIHSIAVNFSRSLLATGGENTNDLAVYRLPTFDPVCLGEQGHSDWLFDIKWLDDEFVVTGSRDSKMALWCIKDDKDSDASTTSVSHIPMRSPDYGYDIVTPLTVKSCKKAEKVRALGYNHNNHEIAALSLNAYVHFWDAKHFIQKCSRKLTYPRENVCMAVCPDKGLYAVGSQSHVTLLDSRAPKHVGCIVSKQRGCGIRSINFNHDMLTIGTGAATIYFYDMIAGKYLELNCGHPCSLTAGKGWLLHDETYQDFFVDQEYPNAIYTHCFDNSGTKLFAAGGPLPAGLWGNYAGLWQ
ncbi:hypothetical protein NP493_1346g00011 [Ridgeia piscesae]|uniref:DDB1- and CUL4-associated factor 12 beta-propeller domain-containing protein n=1 Tax=Ridgeia piscesae TaxID=27915 RepID=A0AAD9K711_RIDPI|nr:hypothetical protein NP493_1346g00011 [Ridgeia piscesae]